MYHLKKYILCSIQIYNKSFIRVSKYRFFINMSPGMCWNIEELRKHWWMSQVRCLFNMGKKKWWYWRYSIKKKKNSESNIFNTFLLKIDLGPRDFRFHTYFSSYVKVKIKMKTWQLSGGLVMG